MKSLFLLAKYYAFKEDSKLININHMKRALKNVDLINKKAEDIILNKLNVVENISELISEDYTQTVKNTPVIKFDKDIDELKTELEKNGITFNDKISNILIKNPTKLEEFAKIKDLKKNLNEKVFSQESAIESICDKLSESVYLKNEKSPKAILFFLGPPATGKTYLSEVLANNLDNYSYHIFDMSNYSDSGQGFALFGLSQGYKDAGEGKLTKAVKENPKSIIVFDEVEKAHPAVLQSFLYLLSQGKVKDEFTQEEIDFTNAILIFTSNLGSELYSNKSFLEKITSDNQSAQTMLLDVISRETVIVGGHQVKALSPEFLSRISQGDVVLFKKLPFDSYLRITKEVLEKNIESFKNALELELSYDCINKLSTILLLTFLPDFDTRRIKSKISLKIFDPITDVIRDENITEIKNIKINYDDKTVNFIDSFIEKSDFLKNEFINEHFRKNISYKFDIVTEYTNQKELILTIKNFNKHRIDKSKDFQGDGKINLEVPTISFSDIAGHKKAKEDLMQIKELLINPKKLEKYNVDIPKGMLLYGIPGTGKTMLAKAFANETDLPFISTTGSEILDINFMKKIFKRAREYAPSIIFIDELDAIGSRNGGSIDIIINQFLTELNGFGDSKDNVFVIAATNLKNKIDPAILRSGRIDQHIHIGNLDKEAREYFIDKIIKKNDLKISDKSKIITYTSGMSGADLEKVNRESSLYLIKNGLEKLNEEILLEQINIIKYGERLKGNSLKELTDATAYHEAGHAVISKILSPDIKIEQITIVPRDEALGFVSYNNEENISNLTKEDIKNKICVLLAGRVSQMKMFKEKGFDSGASSDLAHATHLVNLAISKLGMGDSIGYVSIDKLTELEASSFRKEINDEIKIWIEEGKNNTVKLVEENWKIIECVANTLIKKESIEEQELNKIINEKE